MVEVVDLKTRKHAIDETVIARLEEGLEAARAGSVTAVAIAYVTPDGSTWCSWSSSDKFTEQLGAVARLQHRMQIRQDEAT
jgi:hypothetical protein